MENNEFDSFALLLEGADRQLEDEVRSAFPDAMVSPADNFLGGLEIAVILKPIKEVLESVLQFVSRWRDRYKDASVTLDGKKVDLQGYGPGDAVKIMKAAGLTPTEDG